MNEDVSPQSREILQTSSVNFCIFASLRRITFVFGHFTNIRALFSGVVDGFSLTCSCQNLRKPWNGLLGKSLF